MGIHDFGLELRLNGFVEVCNLYDIRIHLQSLVDVVKGETSLFVYKGGFESTPRTEMSRLSRCSMRYYSRLLLRGRSIGGGQITVATHSRLSSVHELGFVGTTLVPTIVTFSLV